MKGDVNDWRGRLERSPYCKKWSAKDKELFLKFAQDANLHQIGERRIEKYRTDLAMLTRSCGMTPSQAVASMDGLKKAVLAVNADRRAAPETKKGVKRTLGQLYLFKSTGERSMQYAPRELKELTRHVIKAADKRSAKPVITRSELRELLKYGDTEDKAILMLLFESGMRIGEFRQLRKSDVKFIEEGMEVHVPAGKTGERTVVVVEATRYVSAWMEQHPAKKEDAPLWPDSKGKPIGAAAFQKRIKRAVGRMDADRIKNGLPKFSKPFNLHNFRHSRASELGGEQGMTEQILDKYFGWEIGSAMPRVYLHLTEDQVKRAVLRTYGKKSKDTPDEIITHRECLRCHEENPLAMRYCGRCGTDLETNRTPSKIDALEEQIRILEARIDRMTPAAALGTVIRAKRKYDEEMARQKMSETR